MFSTSTLVKIAEQTCIISASFWTGVLAYGLTRIALGAGMMGKSLYVPRMEWTFTGIVFGHGNFAHHTKEHGKPNVDWIRTAQKERQTTDVDIMFREIFSYRFLAFKPEHINHICIANAKNYVKDSRLLILTPMLGNGLVTMLDEDSHTKSRKIINPAFAPAMLTSISNTTIRRHITLMLEELHTERKRLNLSEEDLAKRPMEIRSFLDMTALRIISEAAFRTDLDSIMPLLQQGNFEPSALMLLPAHWFLRIPHPDITKRYRLRKEIGSILHTILEKIRAEHKESKKRGETPSQSTLVDILAKEGVDMDESELLDQLITFVFAGHDTTATGMEWILYHLAAAPDEVQETLLEELSTCCDLGVVPDVSVVQSLPYLRAVVKESMRVNPVVTGNTRLNLEDDVLPGGIFLPKGTMILCSMYCAHHNKELWGDDADEFRPERWIENDGELEDKVSPCGFIPFAVGKRNCIGKEFAMNEMLMTIAVLARNFKIDWPSGEPRPLRQLGIVTKPRKPIRITLRAR